MARELGVYILGATALAILAAAGISLGSASAVLAAAAAAGAAYVSQGFSAISRLREGDQKAASIGATIAYLSLGFWTAGFVALVVATL